jgi:hypothetical protein
VGRPRLAKHPKIAVMEPEDISQDAPETEPVFPIESGGFASTNKSEAVGTALSEGLETLDDIHDFVKAKFGHDMPKSLISSYRSRLGGGKKKAVAASVSKASPEPEGPNKSEAARQAIKAGYDKPGPAVAWINETFGIEMLPTHFSAIKAAEKKKAGARKTRPAKRGRKAKATLVEGYVAPPEKPKAVGEPDVLLALEAIKPLVTNLGADRVKRLADLLA